jgi:OmpA-OmpF porin, OOP family
MFRSARASRLLSVYRAVNNRASPLRAKADVKTESKPSLEQIAAYLKNEPNTRLHVVGHTDSVGGFDSNMGLSKRRADAIVSVLTREHGVAAARLVPNGVAHLAPVASNSSEDGRAKNRRVELVPQ